MGLAIAHRLSKAGRRVVVVEKEQGPGMGVTAGQANVVHVVQLPFSSTKSRLARKGNKMYDGLCAELGVRLDRMPAVLVVTGCLKLPVLLVAYVYLKFSLRGEFRTQLMCGASLRRVEQELSEGVTAGIVVHGYGTVDVPSLVSRLKGAAEEHGAAFKFGSELMAVERGEGDVLLKTTRGDIVAAYVVNAAGLNSDEVAEILGSHLGRHLPGLGVMAVYSGLQLHSIVAPLPVALGARTKGGAIIPATDGTTIVGPTLRIAESEADRAPTEEDLDALRRKFGPLLKRDGLFVRAYAGVRPLSPTKDFVIDFDRPKRTVNLIGIESPGLTAAPAIAELVEQMLLGVQQ